MTIEMVGGRVTVQGKARGSKKKGKAAETPVEATPQLAPSRRGRKKVAAPAPTHRADAPDVPASFTAVTPGHDAKLPEEPPEPTLADLAAGYLSHLEAAGKSQGTVFSYRLELAVALDELGKDMAARELTAERVKAFFESERVTRTRSGRSKSPLSIAKTTRVLRQAIAWGVERGVVDPGVIRAA